MNATTYGGLSKLADDVRWDVDAMWRGFQQPPGDCKPFTRWWWFGTASAEEIKREMAGMAVAGFGGVEIQTVYSALPGHMIEGYREMDWLGDGWLDMVACAVEVGKELGLQVDLTFGNGWPFGGPHVDKQHASSKLGSYAIPLGNGEVLSIPVDDLVADPGKLVGIFAGRADKEGRVVEAVNLRPSIEQGILSWKVPLGDWKLLLFTCEPTNQRVKRAAPAGDGLVLDHLSREAFEVHARRIDGRLTSRFGPRLGNHFGAFFCDSWEVYGENWTPNFAASFKERMGYDVADYLPSLEISGIQSDLGGYKPHVNYDYNKHHADLIIEEFYRPFASYCRSAGVDCRVQPYMAPTDLLLAYGQVDVPEIEGFGQAGISSPYYKTLDPRIASSGAHVYGKPLVSCESFTWLKEHFTATIDDVKAEADQIILCGVNRIIYHGYAFSPPEAGVPGWQFYASIELNHNNTWWHLSADLNVYIARNAFISRQGKPMAMFSVYLPMHDEWMGSRDIRRDLKVDLRESGHLSDYDYVNDERLLNAAHADGGRLAIGDMRYHALVLYKVNYLPAGVARKIADLARDGVRVICVEVVPTGVPGFKAALEREHENAKPAFDTICQLAAIIPSVKHLRTHLENEGVAWDFTANLKSGEPAPLQYLHRTCDNADLYFIVNQSESHVEVQIAVPAVGTLELWLPCTGERVPVPSSTSTNGMTTLTARFKAKEAKWLAVLKNVSILPAFPLERGSLLEELAIAGPWEITFNHPANVFPKEDARCDVLTGQGLFDWTTRARTRFFSGTASYKTDFNIPREMLAKATHIEIDLGTVYGMPEAIVNGERHFAFNHDHCCIDVTGAVQAGVNRIEIRVTNPMLNRIVGYAKAGTTWKGDYYFVDQKYEAFKAEAMEPIPSGLLGPVKVRLLKTS